EDGIRDLTVTGVQTCALPIWALRPRRPRLHVGAHGQGRRATCGLRRRCQSLCLTEDCGPPVNRVELPAYWVSSLRQRFFRSSARSEERRVGIELIMLCVQLWR